MSQKQSQKENSQKAVLTQIQNQVPKPIIVSSQCKVKSQLIAASQDLVPSKDRGSQVIGNVASQSQFLTQTQLQAESQVRNEEDEMRYRCFQ